MLDMGFICAVRAISMRVCPINWCVCFRRRGRRTCAKSPTTSSARTTSASSSAPSAWRRRVPEANRRVAQTVVVCEQRASDGKLIELLRKRYPQGGSSSHYMRSRLIVFGLYKKECARLESDLNRKGGGAWRSMEI